ncbi:MAG TPA: pyridoxamine 5'-phosphate oxidase family protein, partial [Streptosporangiaceae bacterium]
MSRPLPREVADLLRDGALCYLTARTPRGMHVTPVVFAVWDDALWVTTARRSVKARAWRADPQVAGLVRTPAGSAAFGGTVRPYDLLDPSTWRSSLVNAPRITAAAVAFTRRNARFFAGYAVDANKVPLAWTPPGRVFARLDMGRAA